jgi:DNA-binding transcriptional ArsR family regulator
MVEYNLSLDSVFGSLADPTRRDILERVSQNELSVNDIALPYDISLAAVSKHLKILAKAKLIVKRRRGKQHFVSASPAAFKDAKSYLQGYEALWNQRLDALETLLNEGE